MEILLELLPTIVIIVLLLSCSAFFSGSETALMMLSRSQVKRMAHGSLTERAVWGLLQNARKLLATVLVGNMIVNVMLTALCATVLMRGFLGTESAPGFYGVFFVPALKGCGVELSSAGWVNLARVVGAVLNIVIVTPLLMVFGELSPKSFAFQHSTGCAKASSIPLLYLGKLLTPVLWVLHVFVYWMQLLFQMPQGQSWDMLTSDEISAVLSAGTADGVTSDHEKELLERLLHFGSIEVKEIMVPRIQVVGIDDECTFLEASKKIRASMHKFFPVYHENSDDIWGLVSYAGALSWKNRPDMNRKLADFRPLLEAGSAADLPVREVHFAPAIAKVDRVLENMQKEKERFLVVVGEYGGTLGILTINDILSEIIGRFSTGSGNFDYIHPRSDGSFLADGRIRLRILQEALDEDEFNSDADRLSGYIMEMLERLPVVGDTVQTDQYSYTVLRMREKRIRVVQIRKIEPDLDNLAAQEAK